MLEELPVARPVADSDAIPSSPRIRLDLLTALLKQSKSPPTIAHCLRKSLPVHLFLIFLYGGVATILWNAGSDEAAVFFLGLLAGCLLRDLGWFRASVKMWPTLNAVLNWSRIGELVVKSQSVKPNP